MKKPCNKTTTYGLDKLIHNIEKLYSMDNNVKNEKDKKDNCEVEIFYCKL